MKRKEARLRKPATFPKKIEPPERAECVPVAPTRSKIPMPVLHTLAKAMSLMEYVCATSDDIDLVTRSEQLHGLIDDALFFHGD